MATTGAARLRRTRAAGRRRRVLALCLVTVSAVASCVQAFAAPSRRVAALQAGLVGSLLGARPGPVRAEALEQYREKDPALPAYELQRPSGWLMDESTIKQNTWKDYGKTLRFVSGNRSIEVGLQPIDKDKTKLSDFGKPSDFANAFANSAAKLIAPPSTVNPSPVPSVTVLSIDASEDFRRLLAQYRMQVGERPPLIFEQLVGIGVDTEQRNYLYSLTALAPEAEFDANSKLFADVFRSFKFLER
mmetsp:Transcript_1102/g.2379  ORF Transcript_1102/g.2379 Transcript_1102/m.2379 type:complete len:246 (-) Transcript_1102:10-747(-)